MPASKPKDDTDLAARVKSLEAQLAAATAPGDTIPEHGAGVDHVVYETWSQYDQQLALHGDHPDQQPPPVDPEPPVEPEPELFGKK
jgi:hypothetical protein